LTKLLHPLTLLLAILAYTFGASLADYLGKPFRSTSFWLGLIIVTLLQITLNLLPEVYRPHNEQLTENETRLSRRKLRDNALYISMASLASIATLAYILYNNHQLPITTFYFLLFSILLLLSYSIPPLRLLNRGFGEIILAIQLGYIIPSLAFTLQSKETHPILTAAVPITFLAFAYFIIQNFQTFEQDEKYEHLTFLTRLGWERVVPLHHIFVLFAYIFLLAMPAINISLSLVAPAFLTLPFALYQIFQLRNIALGLKPNWLILQTTALAVLGLTLYFLTFTFWTR
jgi:1,4-dihydroxy-2-naphthoate octaprenyltransferase